MCASSQVYLKYGLPKFKPFPGAIKAWLQPAAAGSDFQYLVLSSLFLNAPRPMLLVRHGCRLASWLSNDRDPNPARHRQAAGRDVILGSLQHAADWTGRALAS